MWQYSSAFGFCFECLLLRPLCVSLLCYLLLKKNWGFLFQESGHTGARASKERCTECLCMESMEACADPQAALRVLGALGNGCARVRFVGGGSENGVHRWQD